MDIKELKIEGYEKVFHCKDEESGLNSIIAVNNNNRGRICLGGCRMYPYSTEGEMLKDALTLSKKMTYKNALANLDFGGSKCVIMGDPKKNKSEKLLLAMASFINFFNDKFYTGNDAQIYTGQDVGINEEDVEVMAERTEYLVGRRSKSGDPSIPTGLGVYIGIKAAAKEIFNKDSLKDLIIVVQGLGNVGENLLKYLYKEGCKIIVTDLNKEKIDEAVKKYGVFPIYDTNEIFSVRCHIFSPNVTGSGISGGALDEEKLMSIYKNKIDEKIILAGGTNVVLSDPYLIEKVNELTGLYLLPSEVVNAGGVISVASDITGETKEEVEKKVISIGSTVTEIIIKSHEESKPLNEVTEKIGNDRIFGKGARVF